MAAARSYLGTPWRHQGRTRLGLDCAGLVALTVRDLGVSGYDRTDYTRNSRGQEFLQSFLDGGCTVVPKEARRPGHVLAFRDGAYPCHCGVMGEMEEFPGGPMRPTLIHAIITRKAVVEEFLTQEWVDKLRFVLALPGVEY